MLLFFLCSSLVLAALRRSAVVEGGVSSDLILQPRTIRSRSNSEPVPTTTVDLDGRKKAQEAGCGDDAEWENCPRAPRCVQFPHGEWTVNRRIKPHEPCIYPPGCRCGPGKTLIVYFDERPRCLPVRCSDLMRAYYADHGDDEDLMMIESKPNYSISSGSDQ